MGIAHSTSYIIDPLDHCLTLAVSGNHHLVAFPGDTFHHPFYQLADVERWNLAIDVVPKAVTFPETVTQVAAIIECASEAKVKVQAKSGGHSYGNYGLGGVDGAVVLDMRHFQQFSMDNATWQATIGSGTALGDVTKRLHSAGGRAMAHGTCPKVGIGGHATIGGLGPTSRLWGSALDHVEEVEVVLANSTITRASWTENTDLFFALKGAGAGFGAITEFKVRTEPEPGEVVQYAYSFTHGSYASLAQTFKDWQTYVSDPTLTRKLATTVTVTEIGMVIAGTYYGPKVDFDALDFNKQFFHRNAAHVQVFKDWLGAVGNWAEDVALLYGSGEPCEMFSKSLTFSEKTLIPSDVIDEVFKFVDNNRKGTPLWFIIFDLEAGAVNDVPMDATAYVHRDTIFYLQSYGVGIGKLRDETKDFIRGLNNVIRTGMPEVDFGAYAGYVDPELKDGQHAYWGSNLPKLERIKREVDPDDLFHNPQSVRPAAA